MNSYAVTVVLRKKSAWPPPPPIRTHKRYDDSGLQVNVS